MKEKHEEYMRVCLQLAIQAKEAGKTAVGSIIVENDTILAEGVEGSADIAPLLAHAEVVALVNAVGKTHSKDLSGCILYTTVEPCFMCAYLIRETKISKVVYGAKAGEIGGIHAAFPLLVTNHISQWAAAPITIGGILETECLQVLKK